MSDNKVKLLALLINTLTHRWMDDPALFRGSRREKYTLFFYVEEVLHILEANNLTNLKYVPTFYGV